MSIRSAIEAKRSDNTFTDTLTLSCLCVLLLDLWSLYGNRVPPFLPLHGFNFQAQMLDTVASEIRKCCCVLHCRQEKKVFKSFKSYAKRRISRGLRYLEGHLWPLQLHTKLCLQLAPFQPQSRPYMQETQVHYFCCSQIFVWSNKSTMFPSFFLPTHKFLLLHCASPEPQPVQYFARDCNCFRGWNS